MYAKSLSIVHAPTTIWRLVYAFYCSSLTSYGMNCFLIFHSLLAFFFQGLNLAWLWVIPIFNPLFAPSAILLSFLSYHSAIPAVGSFDPCLLGLFGPAAYSSLNDLIWSLDLYLCYFRLFFTNYIACELLCPISFFLGILGPFSNSAYPWDFTNSFRLP